MAASDQPYRSQRTLDIVFAASCVAMLLATLWMFIQDFQREYKSVQREFRDVETAINERQMVADLPDVEVVDEKRKVVEAKRAAVRKLKEELAPVERQLLAEREAADNLYRGIKADYDSKASYHDILVEEWGKATGSVRSQLKTDVAVSEYSLDRLRERLQAARDRLDLLDEQIRVKVTDKLIDPERELTEAEDSLKRTTSAFDRYAKATATRSWKFGDTLRSLPIVDAFESPTKIRQIWLPNLTIDYGGFRDVPRYDRCTTCHLGIDRAPFSRQALAELSSTEGLQDKVKLARELLERRVKGGEDLGYTLSDLPTNVKTLKLNDAQITQFCAHPRLDLFVDSNSPHPIEKFGCTVCHEGQGSATDFNLASHTPGTEKQEHDWQKKYGWKSSHYWDFPMLSSRFVESSCLKCHHEVTDLIRHGSKEEAPKLLRGYNLLRENGCFGCHEISGTKAGRQVGPDMRLEPTPALDYLTASEQEKLRADAANPPGTFRKVGPGLRRLAEKSNEEWTRKWLYSPRDFREDTRMPHFYNLSTNSKDVLPPEQFHFPAAEIYSITRYLFEESSKGLKGEDFTRKFLQSRLTALQNQLKTGPLADSERKELLDTTRRLNDIALLWKPEQASAINSAAGELRALQERVFELYRKQVGEEELPAGEKDELEKAVGTGLTSLSARLLELATPVPITAEIILGDGSVIGSDDVKKYVVEPDAKSADQRRLNGRALFSEKGCLACHAHNGTKDPSGNVPGIVSEANFGPDLTRLAAKLGPAKADPAAARRWLVQWILNPNIHFPRTRMPVTHLTVSQAADVAEWLLSQPVTDWTEKDPDRPTSATLRDLARLYLSKAPGITRLEAEEYLPAEGGRAIGIPAERMQFLAADADERGLAAPVDDDKLMWYIGKKSVGRLGCFGCHDISGFEQAKPIGTALNDWGRKDAARLAFEDIVNFARTHYNLVEARDNPKEPGEPASDWAFKGDKPPYEKYFFEMLEHHNREGFLNQKLLDPRSYDYNRIRPWDDRLRMPQFQFSRIKQKTDEEEEDFAARKSFEEARAREAVMTFVLGLVAEPMPLQYLNRPDADHLAVVKGRQVLDKFNCAGCHLIRPGVYEFKPTEEAFKLLEEAHRTAASTFATDHFFANHNAWAGLPQTQPDRIRAFGVNPRLVTPDDNPDLEENMLYLRLADALRYTDANGIQRDLPAATNLGLLPNQMLSQASPYGGTWTNLMANDYVTRRYNERFKQPDDARSALPPPLLRQGERVQPRWLYQFLLNPGVIRPESYMLLRMPKFNMSPEDSRALVNYFGAVDKLGNPAAGITYPYLTLDQENSKFWREQSGQYNQRLGKEKLDAREKLLQPAWEAELRNRLDEAKIAVETAKRAVMNAKPEERGPRQASLDAAETLVKKLQEQVDKKDVSELRNRYFTEESYALDAYKLLTNRELCLKCHNIGSVKSEGAQGPPLELAAERLRPEWVLQWVANPNRMFSYPPVMPQNFPKNNPLQWNELFDGTAFDKTRAVRDVLMDLPRLKDLPALRPTPPAAVAAGGTK